MSSIFDRSLSHSALCFGVLIYVLGFNTASVFAEDTVALPERVDPPASTADADTLSKEGAALKVSAKVGAHTPVATPKPVPNAPAATPKEEPAAAIIQPTKVIKVPDAALSCADQLKSKLDEYSFKARDEKAREVLRLEIFTFIQKNGADIKSGKCLPKTQTKESLCLNLCLRHRTSVYVPKRDSQLMFGQKADEKETSLFSLIYSYGENVADGPDSIKLVDNKNSIIPFMIMRDSGANGSPRSLSFAGGSSMLFPNKNPSSPLKELEYFNSDGSMDFAKTCKLDWNPHAFLQMTFLQAKQAQLTPSQLPAATVSVLTKESANKESSYEQPLENNGEFYDDCVVSENTYAQVVANAAPKAVVQNTTLFADYISGLTSNTIPGIIPLAPLPELPTAAAKVPFAPNPASTPAPTKIETGPVMHTIALTPEEEARRAAAAEAEEQLKLETERQAAELVRANLTNNGGAASALPATTPESVPSSTDSAKKETAAHDASKMPDPVPTTESPTTTPANAADGMMAFSIGGTPAPSNSVTPAPAIVPIQRAKDEGDIFQPTREATASREPAVTNKPAPNPASQNIPIVAADMPAYNPTPTSGPYIAPVYDDAPQNHAVNANELRPMAHQKKNSATTNVLFLIGAAILAFFLVSSVKKKDD